MGKTAETEEERKIRIRKFNDAWALDELGRLHGYKSEVYQKALEKYNQKWTTFGNEEQNGTR